MGLADGITEVLAEWSAGDPVALEELMPLVVQELRVLADSHLRREVAGQTLQPTALVNEVYLLLLKQKQVDLKSRTHFFAFASRLMRRILVDSYRARLTVKRGMDMPRLTLDESLDVPGMQDLSLLALDDALTDLKTLDIRQSRVVELRFFGGLSISETATALGISTATVKREWLSAKAYLLREIRGF